MNWLIQNDKFFVEEQKYIAFSFPDLHYKVKAGVVYLVGSIVIDTTINNKKIYDSFIVKIIFPNDYPDMYPTAFEPAHKIPAHFHTNPDYSLCLGTDLEVGMIFYPDKSINNFINRLLLPYLIGFIYFRDYGVLPYGERLHGIDGKLEYYKEIFDTNDVHSILKFLNAIRKGKLRGHHLCPCGSGKFFRNCHWSITQKLFIIPQKLITEEIKSLQSKITS